MEFPYGKAPLVILIIAVLSGIVLMIERASRDRVEQPTLRFATFVKEHADAYLQALPEFEKKYGCTIQIQVVDEQALKNRLQAAFQAGADVPDMVELLDGTMGTFTQGPLEGVGFVDLTDLLKSPGPDGGPSLYDRIVKSRFSKWTSRGRIFALPHDVHPVMLAYRIDTAQKLGIDVSKLTTWDAFVREGKRISQDTNGDGLFDHYMLDLETRGGDPLKVLILQNGGEIFTEAGEVAFDSEKCVEVVLWYIRQINGEHPIAAPAGYGQAMSRSLEHELVLFYLCPDWRTNQFEADEPRFAGKMGLIPLPAWRTDGIRTSTWSGTGLAITKKCKNPELAWKLAMHLYYDKEQLGQRFADTNILPPLKDSWNLPEFDEPRAYWGGIKLGRAYADLAEDVPAETVTAFSDLAVNGKLSEAFINSSLYYNKHGEDGLEDFVRAELKRCADRVREMMGRNRFLNSN